MTTSPVLPPPTRRRWLLPALAGFAILAVAALALFQPWKLWVDETVNEAAPVAAAAPSTPPASAAATTPAPATTLAPTPATTAPAIAAAPATTAPPIAPVPVTTLPAATVPAATVPVTTVPAPTTLPLPPAEPAPTEFRSKAHGTSGTVRLLTLEDGSRVLRIEDLDTDNGPDVKVVLSTDPDAYVGAGSLSLGTLKGNKGSQNYAIPADADLSSLRSVVLWCKRFDVDFGVAALPGA